MGLLDGYFDPDQFGEGGGLLGRLLALQPQHAQYWQGAGFDQPSSVPQAPAPARPPGPISADNGQTSSVPQPPTSDLHSQYQALRPILGDRNAMLATVHPEVGQTLIAQALASPQRDNAANVIQAGYRMGGIPFPFPPGTPVPPPQIPMPAIPDWLKAAWPILRRGFARGAGGGGGGGDYRRCLSAADGDTEQWEDFCRSLGEGSNKIVGGQSQRGACWSKTHETDVNKKQWCENQFGAN